MSFLRSAALTVCLLSVICTLFMMLVPDRYRRDIRSVISLIAAVAVISLILGADFSDISSGFESPDFQSGAEARNQLVQRELESRVGDYIASFLGEEGINCKNISVRTTIDGQNSIFITDVGLWLDPSDEEREPLVRSLIAKKIGTAEVSISYEDS